jgi:ATP-dependent RNA helicase DeaD
MLRTIERVTRQPIEALTLPSRALVADRRVAQFRKQVGEVMKTEALDFFADVVAQLEQEHEGNLAGVAAALLCMAQRAKPLRLQEKEGHSDDGGPRERAPARDDRASRDDRAPRERQARGAPAIEPRGALKPYRIAVGRDHEATPREIVGAIANEAGLASRYIGRIELFAQYSTVELPEDLPAAVLDVLRRTRVKQRALEIRPLGATEAVRPEGAGSERKRPPKRERDGRTGDQPPRKIARDAAPKRAPAATRKPRPRRDKA